jgi:hypothetical protein
LLLSAIAGAGGAVEQLGACIGSWLIDIFCAMQAPEQISWIESWELTSFSC